MLAGLAQGTILMDYGRWECFGNRPFQLSGNHIDPPF